jgi:hypothetical protein
MLSRLAYGVVGIVVVALSFSATLFTLNKWSNNPGSDLLFTASVPSARPASPAPPASATPAAVQEASTDPLPKVQSQGFQWAAIAHLMIRPETAPPVVAGQPVLRLIPTPQDGFHTLAGQFSGLSKNQVYRVTAWVKPHGGTVQLEVGNQAPGQPIHHLAAIFNLANHTVLDGDTQVKDGGIDQGPDGWQKIWLNVMTSDGHLDVTLRPADGNVLTYKGDGKLDVILGGVEVNPRG